LNVACEGKKVQPLVEQNLSFGGALIEGCKLLSRSHHHATFVQDKAEIFLRLFSSFLLNMSWFLRAWKFDAP